MTRIVRWSLVTSLLSALCLGGALTSCSNPSVSSDTVDVAAVSLNVATTTLSIGETFQLVAAVSPADASNPAIAWMSDNPAVATVSDAGLVTAVASGSAKVKVITEDGGYTAIVTVGVRNAYAVMFNTADGSAVETQSVTTGNLATKPADPTRAGYIFDGWYADSACADAWDFAADVITNGTTIYAKWIGIDYTLSFSANGASGSMTPITRACGTDGALPEPEFEAPPGYLFLGWATTSTATPSALFHPGAIATMPAGGITFYAIWGYAFTFTETSGKLTVTGFSGYWPASEISLVFPATIDGKPVTAIGANAFRKKTSLKSITIPSGVTEIGATAFEGCTALVSLSIPGSVETIKISAFYGCKSLVSLSLPSGLKTIEESAFTDCTALTTVSIPASVTSMVAGSAFSGCTELTAITVAADNPNYCSENGVAYTKDKTLLIRCPEKKSGSFVMPGTVTSITDYAFSGCAGITSISWSSSLSSIGFYSFINCTGLTSLSFPASLRYINYYAFQSCSNLASVTLNDGLIQVRQRAFGDTALTTLSLPASVTDFQPQAIPRLTAITVNASNTAYSSIDGVLYSKDQKTFLAYPAAKTGTAYTVLTAVKTIGTDAFTNSSLQTITLPSGLTTIANNGLMQCTNLEALTIPSTVTAIGMNLLWDCPKITELRVNATTPPSLDSTLPSRSGFVIKVPAGSMSAYKAATGWSQYASSIASQ